MIKTKWKKASFYKQIYQNMAIKVVFFFITMWAAELQALKSPLMWVGVLFLI